MKKILFALSLFLLSGNIYAATKKEKQYNQDANYSNDQKETLRFLVRACFFTISVLCFLAFVEYLAPGRSKALFENTLNLKLN